MHPVPGPGRNTQDFDSLHFTDSQSGHSHRPEGANGYSHPQTPHVVDKPTTPHGSMYVLIPPQNSQHAEIRGTGLVCQICTLAFLRHRSADRPTQKQACEAHNPSHSRDACQGQDCLQKAVSGQWHCTNCAEQLPSGAAVPHCRACCTLPKHWVATTWPCTSAPEG